MVLKLPWAQKQMFQGFEKSIFQFFASFCVTTLKPFSGHVRQSVQNYLNQNLVIWTCKKMVLEESWLEKRMFWAFEKVIFQIFGNISVTKLKLFSGKVRTTVENCLNQSLSIESFLESGFEANFSSKMNVVSS